MNFKKIVQTRALRCVKRRHRLESAPARESVTHGKILNRSKLRKVRLDSKLWDDNFVCLRIQTCEPNFFVANLKSAVIGFTESGAVGH
jgi:hypothetical protein